MRSMHICMSPHVHVYIRQPIYNVHAHTCQSMLMYIYVSYKLIIVYYHIVYSILRVRIYDIIYL